MSQKGNDGKKPQAKKDTTPYSEKEVTSAAMYQRPKEGPGTRAIHTVKNYRHKSIQIPDWTKGRSGVVVNTHYTIFVEQNAAMRPNTWKRRYDIPVQEGVKVGDAVRGGYTPGSARLGNWGEYLVPVSGVCYGSAGGWKKE